jgi:hypothetical protein
MFESFFIIIRYYYPTIIIEITEYTGLRFRHIDIYVKKIGDEYSYDKKYETYINKYNLISAMNKEVRIINKIKTGINTIQTKPITIERNIHINISKAVSCLVCRIKKSLSLYKIIVLIIIESNITTIPMPKYQFIIISSIIYLLFCLSCFLIKNTKGIENKLITGTVIIHRAPTTKETPVIFKDTCQMDSMSSISFSNSLSFMQKTVVVITEQTITITPINKYTHSSISLPFLKPSFHDVINSFMCSKHISNAKHNKTDDHCPKLSCAFHYLTPISL